jgi:AcrR family transcriptional regulator
LVTIFEWSLYRKNEARQTVGAPRGVSEVTKVEIRAAARRLFAERGVNGVTVREIAQAAGVTHGLVHRYFGTKEDERAAGNR